MSNQELLNQWHETCKKTVEQLHLLPGEGFIATSSYINLWIYRNHRKSQPQPPPAVFQGKCPPSSRPFVTRGACPCRRAARAEIFFQRRPKLAGRQKISQTSCKPIVAKASQGATIQKIFQYSWTKELIFQRDFQCQIGSCRIKVHGAEELEIVIKRSRNKE